MSRLRELSYVKLVLTVSLHFKISGCLWFIIPQNNTWLLDITRCLILVSNELPELPEIIEVLLQLQINLTMNGSSELPINYHKLVIRSIDYITYQHI